MTDVWPDVLYAAECRRIQTLGAETRSRPVLTAATRLAVLLALILTA